MAFQPVTKQMVNAYMATNSGGSSNPLLQAQYARKNAAVVEHQAKQEANQIVMALRDSSQPLVDTFKSGNNVVAALLRDDVQYNKVQAAATKQLLNETVKAYVKPSPVILSEYRLARENTRAVASATRELLDVVTKAEANDNFERKEDIGRWVQQKSRDTQRNELLMRIAKHLDPSRGSGLFGKVFDGIKFVAGAALGGAALAVGKMVKSILTGQAFKTAGAIIKGMSDFLGGVNKYIGKPLGGAAAKASLGKMLKAIPILGSILTAVFSVTDVISSFNNAADILKIKPEDLKLSDKIAAGLGTFMNAMTFGLSDYLSNYFGVENTAIALKGAFDTIKNVMPAVTEYVKPMIEWVGDTFAKAKDAVMSEIATFQNAESISAYLKDAWPRLKEFAVATYTATASFVTTTIDQAKDYVVNMFTKRVKTDDNEWETRWLTSDEIIAKAKDLGGAAVTYAVETVKNAFDWTKTQVNDVLKPMLTQTYVDSTGAMKEVYLNRQQIIDKVMQGIGAFLVTSFDNVQASISNFLKSEDSGRTGADVARDYIRKGFSLVSTAVNETILFAYDVVAGAIRNMMTPEHLNISAPPGSAEKVGQAAADAAVVAVQTAATAIATQLAGTPPKPDESIVKVILTEILSGVGNVALGAASTLAGRIKDSLTSDEFFVNVDHVIRETLLGPIVGFTAALESLKVPKLVTDAATGITELKMVNFKAVTEFGNFVLRISDWVFNFGMGMRDLRPVLSGMQTIKDANDVVIQTVKSFTYIDDTFIVVKKVADFITGIGSAIGRFGGAFQLLGKIAWPLQVVFSVFDFFSGFSDAVSSERLGVDVEKLTTGQKIISGISSVVKGIIDLPMKLINWVGSSLFEGFSIGNAEDVAGYMARHMNDVLNVITGGSSVGGFVSVMFRGIAGIPWTVTKYVMKGLFGFEMNGVEDVSKRIEKWVDETLSTIKNINIGDMITNAFKKLGAGIASFFGFVDEETKRAQQEEQRKVRDRAQYQAFQTRIESVQGGWFSSEESKKQQTAKIEADRNKWLERNNYTVENGELVKKEIPVVGAIPAPVAAAPAIPNALGNAFTGKIIPYALGGVPDIVNSPTFFQTQRGPAVMGEAGPEGIFPLLRDKQGRLGVNGMMPSIKFPENIVIDLKNGEVTFNETTAKSLADRLSEALKKGFEMTAQFLATAAGYVKQGVNNAIAYVQTNAPQLAQAAGNAVNSVQATGSQMLQAAQEHSPQVFDWASNLATQLGTNASDLRQKMGPVVSQQLDNLTSGVTNVANSVKHDIVPRVKDAASNVQQSVQPLLNDAATSIGPTVENAKKLASNAGAAIVNGSHQVGNVMKDGYNTVSGGIEAFMNKVKRAESNGKAGAVSDTGATGLYQFTKDTWNGITKEHAARLQQMGIQPTLITASNKGTAADPRLNVEAQHAYMKILTEGNAKMIGSDSPGALYLAHFMGPAGAKAIINAVQNGNGNVSALSVMPPKLQQQMYGSPTNMKVVGGKSAQQVLAWADAKMNSSTNVADIKPGSATSTPGSGAVSPTGQAISGGFQSVADAANQMLGGGTVGHVVSGAFGFGGDAATIIDQVINGGGAAAAPVSSAMLGGSGKGIENTPEFQNAMGGLPIRTPNVGRPSLGVRRPSQTAMGQMEITPAPQKPSYREDNVDVMVKELRRQKEALEAEIAELRKQSAPKTASQQVPQTPPTSPVPSIDTIPVMINDMGLIVINSHMI